MMGQLKLNIRVLEMNKELDALLCLLDGKITAYRMKHDLDYMDNSKLRRVQIEIQDMWQENNNSG